MATAQTFAAQGKRSAPTTETAVVGFESVNKRYGSIHALAEFNFKVRPGELVAVLGPNGAGKTTAIRLALGLVQPNSGQVTVFGGNPSAVETHMRVGAMMQVGRVPETLRVREHIDLFSSYYPNPLPIRETLAIAGLEQMKDRKFGALSSGQKQRVLFALAICGDPDLLFLDEPTVGLDVEARHLLWDEIRSLLRRGKTVVLTTHYLAEADALADRILVINKGHIIAQGTPDNIKSRTAGKKIRCVTELPLDVIRNLAGVADVQLDRQAVVIQTSQPENVLRQLLQLDLDLAGIEVSSAGLDDAFLALTREDSGRNTARPERE